MQNIQTLAERLPLCHQPIHALRRSLASLRMGCFPEDINEDILDQTQATVVRRNMGRHLKDTQALDIMETEYTNDYSPNPFSFFSFGEGSSTAEDNSEDVIDAFFVKNTEPDRIKMVEQRQDEVGITFDPVISVKVTKDVEEEVVHREMNAVLNDDIFDKPVLDDLDVFNHRPDSNSVESPPDREIFLILKDDIIIGFEYERALAQNAIDKLITCEEKRYSTETYIRSVGTHSTGETILRTRKLGTFYNGSEKTRVKYKIKKIDKYLF